MKYAALAITLVLFACGGRETEPVAVNKRTDILGSTDSFVVQEKMLPQQILLGTTIKTRYNSFASKRELVMQFLPSIMQRMSKNNLQLKGGVHVLTQSIPNADSQIYFIGVLASGTAGFGKSEIANIPAGKYYCALTHGQTGKSLNLHQMFTHFLKSKNLETSNVYAEKWLEYTEPDMTKREKLELLYKAK